MSKKALSKKKTPPLTRLRFGSPWCELCKRPIAVGELVGWWPVVGKSGQPRRTAYCEVCHHANIRHRRALR
jgi:hypothetical protein